MSRMENPNLDETRPTPVHSEEPAPFDLSDTQPTNLSHRASEEAPDPAQTVPVPVHGEQGLVETIPVEIHAPPVLAAPPAPPALPPKKVKKGFRFPAAASWTILGLIGLLLIATLSAFGGYNDGIRIRKQAQADQVVSLTDEQFQLGLQEMQAGRFDLARQHFEYVIELNPAYPGVTDKLADTLLYLNATATPTVVPTPTITPTPDTRNVEQLFTSAQQELANSEWTKAIDTLLALRKADPAYQPVWVDDMLYVSFRNRGRQKILNADLEAGIYDLTVASKFGLLDVDSRSLQDWARLYITGASFWELDWAQAVYYFAQVAPALPNLADGSGWTATDRYRLALIGYGGDLIEEAEWCEAAQQLELALSMGADAEAQKLFDEANNNCSGPSDEGDGEEDSTETEQPPAETEPPPTEETPTEEPPTETPYP
jgi:tetratricopeptide (TPR) repeat protein